MLNFAKELAVALDALRRHAILFLLGVTLIALALLGRSWLDAHDASLRLQAALAAQQKTITDADQRQSTRDAQLTQTLAQISAAKQKVQTPTQAAAALTQAIPQLIVGTAGAQTLPSPITIELPATSSNGNTWAAGSRSVGILPTDSSVNVQTRNGQMEAGATNSSADLSAPKNASKAADSATANAPSSDTSSGPTAKYPWIALKLELAKLGIGRATESSATKNLESKEGNVASQKGSATLKNTQATAASLTGVSASENTSTQPASNAQTNSPPQSVANAQENSSSTQTNSAAAVTTGSKIIPPPAIIRVPQEDLKPLYDAVEDCQVCRAKLAAAQGDLSDEKTKFAAATAQRDAAISAARGTFWSRTRIAAKWIVIGAAAGAVLARYH